MFQFLYKQSIERENVARLVDIDKGEAEQLIASHKTVIDSLINHDTVNKLPAEVRHKTKKALEENLQAEKDAYRKG